MLNGDFSAIAGPTCTATAGGKQLVNPLARQRAVPGQPDSG